MNQRRLALLYALATFGMVGCASKIEWPEATAYGYAHQNALRAVRAMFEAGAKIEPDSPEVSGAVQAALAAMRRVDDTFGFESLEARVAEVRIVDRSTALVRINFHRQVSSVGGRDWFDQVHVLAKSWNGAWSHVTFYQYGTGGTRS